MMTDSTAERRFLLLKKRLDALHYCQPLTIESSPLVEKLLNDLVKTTEGFQQQKKQIEDTKIQGVKNEQLLAPLKKENGRLITENNSLHMAMIQVKEDCEFKDNKWRTQVRMLEGERNDWKFMVSQKNTSEKKLQEELINLRQKVEFAERKFKGVENYDLNKQAQQSDFEMKALKEEQRKWLDRIQEAQQLTMDANDQKNSVQMSASLLDEKVKHLELQVDNREKEIIRIKSKLDLGSVNLEKLSNDYQLQEQIQKCQRLTTQIDLITEENNRLNNELLNTKDKLSKQPKGTATKKEQNSDKKDKNIIMILQKEQEQQKKLNETLLRKVDDMQDQSDQKILELIQQNEDLATKAQKAENLIQAYQSDKLAFNRSMDQMKGQKDSSEGVLDNQKRQLQDLKNKLDEQDDQQNILKVQSQQFQREKELIERQHLRILDDHEQERDSTKNESIKLNERLNSQEIAMQEMRELLQREQKRTLKATQESAEQRQQFLQGQNKCEDLEVQLKQMRTLGESLERSKEELIIRLQAKNSEKLDEERHLSYTRSEKQQFEEDLQNSRRALKQVERERDEIQTTLDEKTVQNVQQQLRMQKLEDELNKQQGKIVEVQSRGERGFETVAALEEKLRDNQFRSQKMVNEIENLKYTLSIKEKDITKLTTDLLILSKDNKHIETLQKKIEDMQDQSDQKVQQLVQQNEDLATKAQTAENLIQAYQSDKLAFNRSMDQMKGQKGQFYEYIYLDSSEGVLDNYKKLIQDLKNRLVKQDDQQRQNQRIIDENQHERDGTKNESIKLNERLNSQEIAMQEMRELLQREQKRTLKATQESAEQRQQFLQGQTKCEDLEAQLKQMRTLSQSLERSREELLIRLQAKNSEKLDEERNLSHTRGQNQLVVDQLRQCEEELQATRRALEQVDQERDEMQTALDEKTEQNVQQQLRMQKLEDELDKQQGKIVEVQSRGERGFETVAALEEKLRDNQFRSQKMANEIENLRYTLSIKEKDVSELTSDLQILSRENQQLNSQLSRVGQDKDSHQQQQNYNQQQEVKLREQLRLTEMEMRDLQANYGEVCADNQRLQSTLQQLSYQHQDMQARLQEVEKEDDYMGQQMQGAQRKEENLCNQNAQLDRELQVVTRRCEELERQLREAQRNQEQLHKEFNNQRRLSQGFQNTQEDLNRQLLNFEHERKLMQDQVLSLRREVEVKETHFDIERQRANEVENVLIYERENQMRIIEEVQGLRNQNENLLIEMEKIQLKFQYGQRQDFGGLSRVSGESPYIEQQELVNEISQLRVENNRLRGEQFRRSTQMEFQSGDKSREEQNSRLDQSTGWDKLRMESENFKKSLSQAAISSQYLKMKMKGLAREYEVVLPPQKY